MNVPVANRFILKMITSNLRYNFDVKFDTMWLGSNTVVHKNQVVTFLDLYLLLAVYKSVQMSELLSRGFLKYT